MRSRVASALSACGASRVLALRLAHSSYSPSSRQEAPASRIEKQRQAHANILPDQPTNISLKASNFSGRPSPEPLLRRLP